MQGLSNTLQHWLERKKEREHSAKEFKMNILPRVLRTAERRRRGGWAAGAGGGGAGGEKLLTAHSVVRWRPSWERLLLSLWSCRLLPNNRINVSLDDRSWSIPIVNVQTWNKQVKWLWQKMETLITFTIDPQKIVKPNFPFEQTWSDFQLKLIWPPCYWLLCTTCNKFCLNACWMVATDDDLP